MILNELLSATKVLNTVGNTDIDIAAIAFDSRKVAQNTLFVAQAGTAVDGHDYIGKALDSGATAIVCERIPEEVAERDTCFIVVEDSSKALGELACQWFGQPSKQLTLVGVTGTNGKTTIATLLYKLVRGLGHKAGLLSTVVNYIEDEAVASTHTTPDALELNSLLKQMVDAGCTYAFMEVSSHSIAQERIAGLDFDGAIFTNLTRDHIDFHKTFDNYRDTKKRLFDGLKKNAFAITNKDDKNGLIMTQNCQASVYTYSTRALADYRAQILEEGFDGMLLQVNNQEVFLCRW